MVGQKMLLRTTEEMVYAKTGSERDTNLISFNSRDASAEEEIYLLYMCVQKLYILGLQRSQARTTSPQRNGLICVIP